MHALRVILHDAMACVIAASECIEKGDGEVILFLHGVGGNAYSWMPQINSFSMNYVAAAWNMPGYGKSPLFGPMSFPDLADALATPCLVCSHLRMLHVEHVAWHTAVPVQYCSHTEMPSLKEHRLTHPYFSTLPIWNTPDAVRRVPPLAQTHPPLSPVT